MTIRKEIQSIERWLNELGKTNRSFKDIFDVVFREKEKIMFSQYEGDSYTEYSYGEIESKIYEASLTLLSTTKGEKLSFWVAINANNKVNWVVAFWATLLAGYKAFLINPSHTKEINEANIKTLSVRYVIGDTPIDGLEFVDIRKSKNSHKEIDYSHFVNEIALSSSGSSSSSKLAIYSGERIYENLVNFLYVIKKDHDFIKHKGKQHEHLVILPFYHIFGFVLVFMWYSFAHSKFVIPKDLSSSSIRPVINKEKISVIFSIPLLFEIASDKIHQTANSQGKEKKLNSLLSFNNKIQEKFPHLGPYIVRNITARGLRKKTFGTSAIVLGIGGAKISKNTLLTLNGLGYRAINGYGTTELSIFLAAYGCSIKALNTATIGNDPWRGEYRFGENGELSLKLPTCSNYVLENGEKRIIAQDEFISTGDIAHLNNGYFYIDAREDDLLVLPNGEKIYPNIIESYFEFIGVNQYRVINYNNKLLLVVHVDQSIKNEDLYQLYIKIKEANKKIPSSFRIQEIRKTNSPLPLSIKQEVSRVELIKQIKEKPDNFPFISNADKKNSNLQLIDNENSVIVKTEIAKILGIKNIDSINENDDFFTDLGGDSLSYMELSSRLNNSGQFNSEKLLSMSMTTIKEIILNYKKND